MGRILSQDIEVYSTGLSALHRLAFIFIILTISTSYLVNIYPYGIPLMILLSFSVILIAFNGDYYNKILYTSVVIILLGILWLISFVKVGLIVYLWLYYLETGLVSLTITIICLVAIKSKERIIKALIYYDDILKSDPQNVMAWNNKGVQFTLQGRYLMAIECFNKGLEIDPKDAEILYNKGIIIKRDDRDTAQYYINKSLKFNPELKKANYRPLACRTQKKLILS